MSKKLKETSDRVWLAGLGALAVAEQEGNDLFQQLVKRGRKIEKILVGEVRPSPELPSVKAVKERELSLRRVRILGGLLGSSLSLRGSAAGEAPARKDKSPKNSPLHRFLPSTKEKEGIEARQARRLIAARRAFLKEFCDLDKPAVDWEQLQREHKIFTVKHRGATYVPSFQFDEKGKPRPAVARVIQILGKDTSDWGLALWFTAASGHLDDQRPVDLLSSQPEGVVQAAEQEAAELAF